MPSAEDPECKIISDISNIDSDLNFQDECALESRFLGRRDKEKCMKRLEMTARLKELGYIRPAIIPYSREIID